MAQNTPTYRGLPVTDLSREELIEAVLALGEELRRENETARHELEYLSKLRSLRK